MARIHQGRVQGGIVTAAIIGAAQKITKMIASPGSSPGDAHVSPVHPPKPHHPTRALSQIG